MSKTCGLFDLMLRVWHMPFMKRLILAVGRVIPDDAYIKIIFKGKLGYSIDLKNPKTFNEKLNWCKLYNRNPLYTKLADKYSVKQIVADKIGRQYVVKNLGVWQHFDEIDFEKLPNRFVLKCTHDSSGVIVCKDLATFDYKAAREKLEFSLKMNYFYACREWPYKNIPPLIIADELLDDQTGKELQDYKFWCFNGEPKIMYITNKGAKVEENFYDMDFNILSINHGFPRTKPEYQRPKEFELMKELAAKLSVGIPFVRVDFFDVNGRVYFGEFTFFDWAGLGRFSDIKTDEYLGKLITLPQKTR